MRSLFPFDSELEAGREEERRALQRSPADAEHARHSGSSGRKLPAGRCACDTAWRWQQRALARWRSLHVWQRRAVYGAVVFLVLLWLWVGREQTLAWHPAAADPSARAEKQLDGKPTGQTPHCAIK